MKEKPYYKEENPKEEWEKFKEDICGLCEELMEILKCKNGEAGGRNIFLELTWGFARKIEEKYVDCRDYVAFHILIGSELDFNICPKLDFPNPLSVKSFLLNAIRKFNGNEEQKGETRELKRKREREEKCKKEEWEQFEKEMLFLRKRLLGAVKKANNTESNELFFRLIWEFLKQIKERYKEECDRYLAFHILAASGTEFYHSPNLDFPEPFSVKKFLEEKICEYEKK